MYCPDYREISEDKKECNEVTCTGRKRLSKLGKCEQCDEFRALSQNGYDCIDPQCEDREIVLPDGKCKKCDDYLNSDDVRTCKV